MPQVERIINESRRKQSLSPVDFVLSDLYPNLDDWIPLASTSAHLSFIPQPVNAINPPSPAMSDYAASPSLQSNSQPRRKVIRLFCLSFHHFDDDEALEVMRSTLETADGFVILELQERRISSLILMVFLFLQTLFVQVFWFWRRPSHLLFTYTVPILPLIMAFDGMVSALRTRTLEELVSLVIASRAERFDPATLLQSSRSRCFTRRGQLSRMRIKDWTFHGGRMMHTVPIGYFNWFVGIKG